MDESMRLRLPHEMTMEQLAHVDPRMYTKEELFFMCKHADPKVTRAQFERMWNAFQAEKATGAAQAPQ